uniref:SJCHGC09742 protein n=1 Tax=Schistosoma japonicum TaxID=6182 RepID=Q5BR01_SCHJA|nr:SJCHGC09742 protein [Schistosoma japonicum]
MYLGLSYFLYHVSHFSDQYSKFKNINVDERIEFIRKNKVYLKASCIAKDCQSTRTCTFEGCGGQKHTLLHTGQK